MNSNPCCNGLRRQTAEGVVRVVAYHPRQRVLLAARLECRLAAGSRPRNGDERRSLVLWAVREPTSHWGLCLFVSLLQYSSYRSRHHIRNSVCGCLCRQPRCFIRQPSATSCVRIFFSFSSSPSTRTPVVRRTRFRTSRLVSATVTAMFSCTDLSKPAAKVEHMHSICQRFNALGAPKK